MLREERQVFYALIFFCFYLCLHLCILSKHIQCCAEVGKYSKKFKTTFTQYIPLSSQEQMW